MYIVVYGTPTCPKCDEIKKWLQSQSIPFQYQEVGKDLLREELELIVSRVVRAVPVVTLNGVELSVDDLKKKVTEKTEEPEILLSELRI